MFLSLRASEEVVSIACEMGVGQLLDGGFELVYHFPYARLGSQVAVDAGVILVHRGEANAGITFKPNQQLQPSDAMLGRWHLFCPLPAGKPLYQPRLPTRDASDSQVSRAALDVSPLTCEQCRKSADFNEGLPMVSGHVCLVSDRLSPFPGGLQNLEHHFLDCFCYLQCLCPSGVQQVQDSPMSLALFGLGVIGCAIGCIVPSFLGQWDLPSANLLVGGMSLHLGYGVGPRRLLLYTLRYAFPNVAIILQTPWLICAATCC